MKNDYKSVTIMSIVFLLFAAGCSSVTAKNEKQIREDVKIAMENVGYKCEKTITTGSNIKRTRCSTAKQREQQRETARRVIIESQSGGKAGDDRNSF